MTEKAKTTGKVDIFARPSADTKTLSEQHKVWLRTAKKSEHMLNVLAASCVLHMIEKGNATPMTHLVHAAETLKGVRTNALVAWAMGTGLFKTEKEEAIDARTGKTVQINVFRKTDDKARFEQVVAKYKEDKDAFSNNLVVKNAFVLKPPGNPFKDYNLELKLFQVLEGLDRIEKLDEEKKGEIEIDATLAAGLRALLQGRSKPKAKTDGGKGGVPKAHVIDAMTSAEAERVTGKVTLN